MNLKTVFVMFGILVLLGVSGGCFGARVNNNIAFNYEELKTMESKWKSLSSDNYTFYYGETGAKETYDLKVKVVNGERESICRNNSNSGMRYDERLTIDELMGEIEKSYIDNSNKVFESGRDVYITKIDVTYNEKYGYPEEIKYEYNKPPEGMNGVKKEIKINVDM